MSWKRKLLIGFGVFFISIIILGFIFNDLIPYSFDRSTFTDEYKLENAFPNLTFNNAVELTNDGVSNNIYVVEQEGVIYQFSNDPTVSSKSVFLDIQTKVRCCGETGLLGLTFDPNYIDNGYFYVDYTAADPLRTIISRFTVENGQVNLTSELEILSVNQPYANHNAGSIKFGPDGMLYVTLGDGGSFGDPHENGQNLGTLLGSILRINVTDASTSSSYSIPNDNPFVNTSGTKGEIWAYGLRNPWKISFDAVTGDLWVGDVGQNSYEEVDLIVKGGNYGWNTMEASHCYDPDEGCDTSGLILPIAEYGRDLGKSITGGYVYRGDALPGLVGKYIYADYISSRFWHLDAENPENPRVVSFMKYNLYISGFGEDINRELFVLQYDQSGVIYKIVPLNS